MSVIVLHILMHFQYSINQYIESTAYPAAATTPSQFPERTISWGPTSPVPGGASVVMALVVVVLEKNS